MKDESTPERNPQSPASDQCGKFPDTGCELETITPDHPEVLPWAEARKRLESLSPTERAKYLAESQELWEKYSEAPPRMVRTFRGLLVRYE